MSSTVATPAKAVAAVTTEHYGKDHWSLLAYVETLCVDGKQGVGEIDKRKVRCNQTRHPQHQVNLVGSWQPKWGTRLAGFFDFEGRADPAAAEAAGLQLSQHDDWDCLDDLEAAGLIEVLSQVNGMVQLTPAGIEVSALLRKHKAEGGMFATFKLPDGWAAPESAGQARAAIERHV